MTPVPAHGPDVLADSGWDAVVEEALSGRVEFPGGRLLVAPTPAMPSRSSMVRMGAALALSSSITLV